MENPLPISSNPPEPTGNPPEPDPPRSVHAVVALRLRAERCATRGAADQDFGGRLGAIAAAGVVEGHRALLVTVKKTKKRCLQLCLCFVVDVFLMFLFTGYCEVLEILGDPKTTERRTCVWRRSFTDR